MFYPNSRWPPRCQGKSHDDVSGTIWTLGEHFRQYAHAFKFAVGLHDTQKFHPIVKYKHYQIQITSGLLIF